MCVWLCLECFWLHTCTVRNLREKPWRPCTLLLCAGGCHSGTTERREEERADRGGGRRGQIEEKRVKRGEGEINRARCVRWAYFQEKYHNFRKYAHTLFEEPLKFMAHGRYFRGIVVLGRATIEGGERDEQNGYPVYTHHTVASWPLPQWWVEATHLLSMIAGSSPLLLHLSYH